MVLPAGTISLPTRVVCLLAAALLAAPWARADTTETTAGGDWFDSSTWSNGIPGLADVANIYGGKVLVQKSGAGAGIIYSDGLLMVLSESPLAQAGALSVGSLYVGLRGTGTVELSAGGRVATSNVYLASIPGASAIVTIDGTATLGGERSGWTNSGEFFVGVSSTEAADAGMRVTSGATVRTMNTTIGSGLATGTIDLRNSTWTNSNLFTVGGGAKVATLSLSDSAVLTTRTGVISGSLGAAFGGKAFVDRATWTSTGDLVVAGSGSGQLTVLNGGVVNSAAGTIGDSAKSVGTATFSDSAWNNSGALIVGLYGDGQLTINRGSTVTSALGVIGRYDQSRGSVAVDGGRWAMGGDLIVGSGLTGLPGTQAEGTLVVRNGGTLSSVNGFLGQGAGARGTVEVRGRDSAGKASSWTMTGELQIGSSGFGTLTVSGSGLVKSPVTYLGPSGAQVGGGTLNLIGSAAVGRGVLETGQLLRSQGRFEANGGELRASADQAEFVRNAGGIAVLANGLFVNSNGHRIGIDATLTGDGGLTKLGAGTLDLRGLSFLGSLSTVEAGTLLVNDSFSGDLQVNAGATLGGSGQINGRVDVLPGGTLSPGNSPGNLTLGALTLGRDAHLVIELGTISDHLTVNGYLALGGVIDFIGDPAFFGSSLPSFISYSGALTDRSVAIGLLPGGVDRSRFALDFGTPGRLGLGLAQPGGVPIPPVPEPSSIALMLLGTALLLVRRWRGRRAD